MFSIQLNNLSFFSFHGLYEEEKLIGNDYEVDVAITTHIIDPVTSIDQTINYASLYEIIEQRMAIPTPLLETIAQDLVQQIYKMSEQHIKSIAVSIRKKYPPFPNVQGAVSVTYKKEF